MIRAEIFILDWSGQECENENCPHSLEYHDQIIGENFFIKKGTPILRLDFTTGNCEFYCRDCIDTVYTYLKSTIDTKLWPFK